MKVSSYVIVTVALVAAALVTEPVFARGGRGGGGHGGHAGAGRGHSGGHHYHGRTGVFVGAGVVGFAPWWGYPAYGVVSAYPPAPLQYIEKGDGSAPAEIEWFYCRPLNAYFPYVAECPGGWERVAPEAASG